MNIELHITELNLTELSRGRDLLRKTFKNKEAFINCQKEGVHIYFLYSIFRHVEEKSITDFNSDEIHRLITY